MSSSVVILGAGKIGRMIARLLIDAGDFDVRVADRDPDSLERLKQRVPVAHVQTVDAGDHDALVALMAGCNAVVSALSFAANPGVARAALEAGASYFDLTEDRATTEAVRTIAADAKPGQVFVPQCGLAPGFISIVTGHLIEWFDELDAVRMRVGALPQYPTNALTYNLTWSTEGLINEYCNPCDAVHEGRRTEVLPLEGLEHFSLDGTRYEAFNTSGGPGSLCESYDDRVREMNYKTIRYPGHHQLMTFLLRELRLSERRSLLKDVLETAVPITFQDVVVVFSTVTGMRNGQFVQKSDARKLYSRTIGGEVWSAIQITTASAVCALLDLHLKGGCPDGGFVRQEDVDFNDFIQNRFGRWYDPDATATVEAVPHSPAPAI